jgi:3-deoxy-D-manno-octulosonic-acid transferase
MGNFEEIVPKFLEAKAAIQVPDEDGLERAVDDLLSDPGRREELGRRAEAVVEANRGALKRTLDVIEQAVGLRSAT